MRMCNKSHNRKPIKLDETNTTKKGKRRHYTNEQHRSNRMKTMFEETTSPKSLSNIMQFYFVKEK